MSTTNVFKAFNDPDKGLQYLRPAKLREFLDSCKGETLIVTFDIYDPEASYNQHAYYRIINRWLKTETEEFGGWTEDEISEFAIEQCGTEETVRYLKEKPIVLKERINLKRASQKKMAEFMNKWIEYLYASLNISVPPPKSLTEG